MNKHRQNVVKGWLQGLAEVIERSDPQLAEVIKTLSTDLTREQVRVMECHIKAVKVAMTNNPKMRRGHVGQGRRQG